MVGHEGDDLAAETAKKVLAAVKRGPSSTCAGAEALAARASTRNRQGEQSGQDGKDKNRDAAANDSASASDRSPEVEISAPFNSSGDPITGAAPGQSVAQTRLPARKRTVTRPTTSIKLDDGYAVMQLKEKNPRHERAVRERA